jgi:signal peptidase I
MNELSEQTPVSESPTPTVEKPSSDHFWRFAFILFAIFIPLRLFVAEPFLVYGSSMEPNFDTGDYLIVDELTYRFEDPKRGDVIVLKPPVVDKEKSHFIKRIVGLPGETVIVQNGKVTIKNTDNPDGFTLDEPYLKYMSNREAVYKLASDEYFVMGDNRPVSSDSRNWGPLKRDDITGRAFLRLYPLKHLQVLPGSLEKFQK